MELGQAYQRLKQVLVRDPVARGQQPAITGLGLMWNATDGVRLEVRAANTNQAVRAYHAAIHYTGVAPYLVRAVAAPLAQAQFQMLAGDAIGHQRCMCYGTLGAFLVARGKQTLALSNSHVLGLGGRAKPGDPIFDRYGNHVGSLFKATKLSAWRVQRADAALALLNNNVQPAFAGTFGAQEAILGDQVYKDGASTARTFGTVTSTSYTLAVNVNGKPTWFEDQLVIEANPIEKFSTSGDSGSLIRHSFGGQPALGLLFAGDEQPIDLFYRTYANPIHAVFEELNK